MRKKRARPAPKVCYLSLFVMHSVPLTLALLGDIGGPELFLILFLVLILFGSKRLPELARGMGKAMREFKKATSGVEEGIRHALEDEPAPKAKPSAPKQPPAAEPPADSAS